MEGKWKDHGYLDGITGLLAQTGNHLPEDLQLDRMTRF